MYSFGISAITYNALKNDLKIEGRDTEVYDIPLQIDVIGLARVCVAE
jgi:hypothetical protein